MKHTALLATATLLGSTLLAHAITPAPQNAPSGLQLVQDNMKDKMKDEKMSKDDKMKKDSMKKDDKMMKKDEMKK
jgi:hypothetical protein